MALLFDFLPIVAFFVTLKLTDVYIATGVAVAASLVGAAYQKIKTGKVAPMMLVSAGLMVVFGGLTIALHDETFVKWKPTVLEALFAVIFFVSRFVGAKPVAERLLGKTYSAPRKVWLRVNDGLALFCVGLGALNLWVAYTFSTDAWATFKVFGFIGLNFVAILVAVFYLEKRGTRLDPAPQEPPAS